MSTISETRTALPTGTWQIDPVHSTVEFSVKHMVVANFRGGFDAFDVTVDEAGIRGTVDVSSVRVSEPNLTGHLLAPDFFDAERHPQLSFNSATITVSDDELTVDGELTLKGITKPVVIKGTVNGPVTSAARVRVTWPAGAAQDTSDVDFRVGSRIAVTAPNTALTWGAESTRTVTWNHDYGVARRRPRRGLACHGLRTAPCRTCPT